MLDSIVYMFSDVAGENFLVLGPGGISWINPFEGDSWSEGYRVQGSNNARSFAAWLQNTQDCHVVPVMYCDWQHLHQPVHQQEEGK